MWNPPHRFWVRSLVAALAAWVADEGPGGWASSRSFLTPAGTGDVRGLDVLPNGNLLTSSAQAAQVRELSSLDGSYPVDGIAIQFPAFAFQVESAVHVPGSPESLYVADEEGTLESGRIYRTDLDGNPLNLPGLGTDNFPFGAPNFDDPVRWPTTLARRRGHGSASR